MKHKILLLDDSPTVREGVRRKLAMAGYEVFAVSNFVEANHVFYHDKPELVLIDVNLGPLMRGDKVLELYLTKSSPAYAPILLLFSDMAAEELAALAAECGATGFITKRDDLVAKVADYLLHRPLN